MRGWLLCAFLLLGCHAGSSERTSPPRLKIANAELPARATGAFTIGGVTMHALDLRDVAGVRDGERIVYRDAATATDVIWLEDGERAEELRILYGPSASPIARYRFDGKPSVRDGRVEVHDTSGRLALASEPLYAIDATGRRRELSLAVDFDTVTTSLDTTGLTYPITVDPSWSPGPPTTVGRRLAAMVGLPDGTIVVGGGNDLSGLAVRAWEIYRPSTGVFSLTTMTYQGAGTSGVATGSGKVLLLGGADKTNLPSRVTILIDPATGTTATGGNPLRSRYRAAMVSFGEVVYAIGGSGFDDNGEHVARADLAVSPPTWTAMAPMVTGRGGHTATVLADDTVLVVGGGAASAERYNRITNTWSAAGTNAVSRTGHIAARLPSGRVLVAGGGSATTELYDPIANTWSAGPSMAVSHADPIAVTLGDGRVVVAGGGTAITEVYNPATNTWLAGGSLSTARSQHMGARLADGRVLVSGGLAPTAPTNSSEIWGALIGGACTTSVECISGTCVDGVCCSTSSCPTGFSCAVPGKRGTCAKALGSTCTAATDCGSGLCVDGVCCDGACTGQCEACNVAGAVGKCVPTVGAPVSGRTACTGAGTSCGARCDGIDPTRCTFPKSGVACGSDGCSGAVETHVGTCDGAGACAASTKSCGAYACGSTTCLTSCASSGDCASGFACKSGSCVPVSGLGTACDSDSACASAHCVDGVCCGDASCPSGSSCALAGSAGSCKKKLALPCTTAAECGSGQCIDGVCCDNACAGQCEACDVEGRVGTCSPISGKPHGARTACDAPDICATRACDGATDRTRCTGFAFGPEKSCGDPSCSASSFTAAAYCDGKGACTPPAASSCSPYGCDTKGCLVSCTASEQCAPGFSCKGSRCEPKSADCSPDRLTSIGTDGTSATCSPFLCRTESGDCATLCNGSEDCATGFVCENPGGPCVAAPSPVEADSGGCAIGRPRDGMVGEMAVMTLLAITGLVSRRARKGGAR